MKKLSSILSKKCIFLDRDGVVNEDNNYTFKRADVRIIPGVPETLNFLAENNFLIIVITNQSGIGRGYYSIDDMRKCNSYINELCGNTIEKFYFSPTDPYFSKSLSRKPESLLFEKAIAKYNIDSKLSWMVGDKERDLIPAHKLGIKTLLVGGGKINFKPDLILPSLASFRPN